MNIISKNGWFAILFCEKTEYAVFTHSFRLKPSVLLRGVCKGRRAKSKAKRKTHDGERQPNTETTAAGFLRCTQKSAPRDKPRSAFLSVICCIFSCGCNERRRSGQYPQPALPQSKARHCCLRRSGGQRYRQQLLPP